MLPRMAAVTADDIQRVAKKYLDPQKRVVVWSVPKASKEQGGGAAAATTRQSLVDSALPGGAWERGPRRQVLETRSSRFGAVRRGRERILIERHEAICPAQWLGPLALGEPSAADRGRFGSRLASLTSRAGRAGRFGRADGRTARRRDEKAFWPGNRRDYRERRRLALTQFERRLGKSARQRSARSVCNYSSNV